MIVQNCWLLPGLIGVIIGLFGAILAFSFGRWADLK